ncbi:UTRA domain-containing protein [Virgibacillus dakarensis]|uniref:HTH-type transcriptional repressor YvoA n=1 Tax=Lentibacillus populi TaxID=1827502 RepID=A0A9W5U0Y6_9BACI|nr:MULTISPECIES: GntR family transcriptional regulator [Bacillaceae]MBT2216087.1 GntR family transcriptional regulator [Virgibacillus dakarensis]MTW86397.1 UTRA domain-containing protein [Virgibacillus dakarensis]GGB55223.1 HTH-type transcriptional repressor YvoA [Lentibacillus populi]
MIDKNSPLPIYYQIEEEIKRLINTKQLTPGELLPSEREYAEKYNISRMTVRQAINNLAAEGLLYRLKGKGTFVAEKKFEQNLQGLTSFSEDMRARGLTPANQLIGFQLIKADEKIANLLYINMDDLVYEIKRIRLANNTPIALETIYTPQKLVGKLQEKDFTSSFYQFIEEKLRLTIGHSDQIIESVIANDVEIEYLHMKQGDPILLMQRITYLNDDNETPLEYVKSAYRADKYKFKLQMKR